MTLTGLFVPLITPFDATGEVAADALAALAHEVLAGGATGLLALGTTAEVFSLTDAEKRRVVDVLGGVCRELGAPLIVGGGDDVRDRPEVVASLCLVPPFVRPGEAGVIAHFARLAGPVIVYDVPRRTGQYLTADALRRLAALPNIVGVKYAPGEVNADTLALLADPPPDFAILCGDDPFASTLLALGAHGAVLATAHVATAAFARLVSAWRDGDIAIARPLGGRLSRLSTALFAEPNPTVIKAVLHAQGRIPTAGVRPPLLAAAPVSHLLDEIADTIMA
ncbi:MAG TPA: dihydrodipicolinate synthase family protein [Pseudonocardiaceae bacterium]|jgi:4-hydroxy-tetrahydrodipicolinate synthase